MNQTITPITSLERADVPPPEVATELLLQESSSKMRKIFSEARAKVWTHPEQPLRKLPDGKLGVLADGSDARKTTETRIANRMRAKGSITQLAKISRRARRHRRGVQYQYIKLAEDTSDRAAHLRAGLDALAEHLNNLDDGARSEIKRRTTPRA